MLPLFNLLDPNRVHEDWGPRDRAGLRSALLNRQWTQARLFVARLVDTPHCRLCLAAADGSGADAMGYAEVPAGTFAHRMWSCASLQPRRASLAPSALVHEAFSLMQNRHLDSAQWLHALAPLFAQAVPPRHSEGIFAWVLCPAEGTFQGTAYIDGSLLDGSPDFGGLCGRFGWAFVVLDGAGTVIVAAHGVPPWWVHTIHGAELWVLQMAILHALSGSAYRIDCLSVAQTFEQGMKHATSSGQVYARIWNILLRMLMAMTRAAWISRGCPPILKNLT